MTAQKRTSTIQTTPISITAVSGVDLKARGVVGVALNATEQILKNHSVKVEVFPDLPLVLIDAILIARVLINLLENASKYTPPHSEVILAAQVIGDQLSTSVADSGPGLPVGREEEIFQKFTRGDRESSTPGVGLGLTICRAAVESHHGNCRQKSSRRGGYIHLYPAAWITTGRSEPRRTGFQRMSEGAMSAKS